MHSESRNELTPEVTAPQTLKGLKRQATKIKKAHGIRHLEALEIVAKSMGYDSYQAAFNALSGDHLKPN